LFHVYPTIPEGIREIDEGKWEKVAKYVFCRDNYKISGL
jgi:hypothetical protein